MVVLSGLLHLSGFFVDDAPPAMEIVAWEVVRLPVQVFQSSRPGKVVRGFHRLRSHFRLHTCRESSLCICLRVLNIDLTSEFCHRAREKCLLTQASLLCEQQHSGVEES